MSEAELLALALDPSRLLKPQGIEADPWQKRLLLSPGKRQLLCCSRGAGKSRTCSILALHTALFEADSLTLILSRAQRQASELLRYVRQGYRALDKPIRALAMSETCLELANGSRILSLPGSESTIRSYQGVRLLIIDEAARVPDELYYSVRPMLNVSQGKLVCLSTPFGPRGFFWRAWHDEDAPWERTRITWRDCPRIRAADIEEERRTMGDHWVAQEYECSFISMHGLVYPDFAKCIVEQEVIPEGRKVGGIDFGWRNPFAAVWGVLDAEDVLWIVGEHYARQVPLHRHAALLKEEHGVMWYADPAGRTEIEELRAAGLRVRRGENAIRAGIAAVSARIQSGRLKVIRSRCPHLIGEARMYRYPTGEERTGSAEVPLDEHNHALAALRYLISKLDAHFMARMRK